MANIFYDINAKTEQEQLKSEKRYRIEQIKHYNKDLDKENKKTVIFSLLGSLLALNAIIAPNFMMLNNAINLIGFAGFNATAILGYVMLTINSLKNKTNIKKNIEDENKLLAEIENKLNNLSNEKESKGINLW